MYHVHDAREYPWVFSFSLILKSSSPAAPPHPPLSAPTMGDPQFLPGEDQWTKFCPDAQLERTLYSQRRLQMSSSSNSWKAMTKHSKVEGSIEEVESGRFWSVRFDWLRRLTDNESNLERNQETPITYGIYIQGNPVLKCSHSKWLRRAPFVSNDLKFVVCHFPKWFCSLVMFMFCCNSFSLHLPWN